MTAVYTTVQVARLAHVHPNTVRLYEAWGYMSPVPRRPNGYRQFSDRHVDELIFARMALPGPYPADGSQLRAMVAAYVQQDYAQALALVNAYKTAVAEEKRQADEALRILDRWHQNQLGNGGLLNGSRRTMADRCRITPETLRTWERNGLLTPHRTPSGRIRYTEQNLEQILVIRLLRKCGFSIASLLRVFGILPGHMLPSEYLTRIYANRETACESDHWLAHLEQHRIRAENLISYLHQKIPSA